MSRLGFAHIQPEESIRLSAKAVSSGWLSAAFPAGQRWTTA